MSVQILVVSCATIESTFCGETMTRMPDISLFITRPGLQLIGSIYRLNLGRFDRLYHDDFVMLPE